MALEFCVNGLSFLIKWIEDNCFTKTQIMKIGKSSYDYELALESNNISRIRSKNSECGVLISTPSRLTFASCIKSVLSITSDAKVVALHRMFY